MSLRWKMAIALALVAACATTLIGLLGYRTTHDQLYQTLDRSLVEAAVLVRNDGRRDVPARGILDVYTVQGFTTDGTVVGEPNDVGLPITEVDVALVGSTGATSIRTVVASDGARYRMVTMGRQRSAFQVARPLEETDRVLGNLRSRTIFMVSLIVVAAAAVGWLIARSVTGPLRRLTQAAAAVEESGRLDVDVAVAGDDEAGRLGAAFTRMLATLDRSRSDQQRLVQDAGHELRTPLTSLRTNLDVLRRHPDIDPALRDRIVADLHAETEELVTLVNEVVAAATGAGDVEEPEPLVLGALTRSVAERVARRSGREIHVDADDVVVVAPKSLVERAITNLLDNATKFDQSGAAIDVLACGGTVEVADRGPGIPDGEADQIFERFHRAAEARTMPGSGLGLSIVRDVAERHGGSVWATNRDGGGARIGFRLPVHN
jgi:two-component system sensor histidine kinase MprB